MSICFSGSCGLKAYTIRCCRSAQAPFQGADPHAQDSYRFTFHARDRLMVGFSEFTAAAGNWHCGFSTAAVFCSLSSASCGRTARRRMACTAKGHFEEIHVCVIIALLYRDCIDDMGLSVLPGNHAGLHLHLPQKVSAGRHQYTVPRFSATKLSLLPHTADEGCTPRRIFLCVGSALAICGGAFPSCKRIMDAIYYPACTAIARSLLMVLKSGGAT